MGSLTALQGTDGTLSGRDGRTLSSLHTCKVDNGVLIGANSALSIEDSDALGKDFVTLRVNLRLCSIESGLSASDSAALKADLDTLLFLHGLQVHDFAFLCLDSCVLTQDFCTL